MDDVEVERAWGQLARAIDEAIQLLRSVGESFWTSQLEDGRAKIEAHSADGLDSVLRLFGGMGSFNDLVLHPMNGHELAADDLDAANDRLWELRDQIYTPATELRRAFPS